MSYLTEEEIQELSSRELEGSTLSVIRGNSRQDYILHGSFDHGMKGVVWRGCDDIGQNVAIKFMPASEYRNRSLIDEMTEAGRLGGEYFAAVRYFGDVSGVQFRVPYKCVVTEWIDGVSIDEFTRRETISVSDFMSVAEKLFTVLAILGRHGLCHDDLHPGNILIQRVIDPLSGEPTLSIKVIDTGTIKRAETRSSLLSSARSQLKNLEAARAPCAEIARLREFLEWKEPDDHLRVIESLLRAANCLIRLYSRLDFWERKFIDQLHTFFDRATDDDLERRLDSPERAMEELRTLARASRKSEEEEGSKLSSPFDYISAEMIRNNREFAELFSKECPWLDECKSLEPLYIYGPRGCGKSSVLRWLAFKTLAADPTREIPGNLKEVGVYVSCSVELRSRFWLLGAETIDRVQALAIRYFSLLLLEELFDTLDHMEALELKGHEFGLRSANKQDFVSWCLARAFSGEHGRLRLQGQGHFAYLKSVARRSKWDTWAAIQSLQVPNWLPDPAVVSDVCRELSDRFDFFRDRHITFLLDDYSNQRIPTSLQVKLNQTISFAKQGTPIFKVSSEYLGVDLEGIQEGREVVEINVGERYTSLEDGGGATFLADIVNIRLRKAGYKASIRELLGSSQYDGMSMAKAIAEDSEGKSFYYHGIETVHWLCSGDLALALDVIRRIFDKAAVNAVSRKRIEPHEQHAAIHQFSHEEIKRIKHIVPYGDRMYDIVCYLGAIARAFVVEKRSERQDKSGDPVCKTHLDIRAAAIREFEGEEECELQDIFKLLVSRAIFISLNTSRSRISGGTERYQMKRIFFPAFKAPVARDVPIKIDTSDHLKSLLSNPHTFAERECARSKVPTEQLDLAIQMAKVKPRE